MHSDVFVSGWAGYACLFPRLAKTTRFFVPFSPWLEEELRTRVMEGSRGGTLLAWSTGAHMVLRWGDPVLACFDRVVLIAPFLDFTRCLPLRIVHAMRGRVEKECLPALTEFYANCGLIGDAPDVSGLAVPEELVRGLTWLADASLAPVPPLTCSDRIHVIHGRRDRIVPARALKDVMRMLPCASLIRPDCGHYIPEEHLFPLLHEITDTKRL